MALLGTYLEYIGCNGKKVPNGHWKNKDNHKIYCEYLFKKLGYTTIEDWYKVGAKDFKRNEGSYLLKKYNWSPIKVLSSVYPEYEWLWWKFENVSRNKWSDITNITEYMDWLGNILGYTIVDDWYKITRKDIINNYGCNLIWKYGSLIKILNTVYPKYKWLPWKFNKVGNGKWKDPYFQKDYIVWLGKEVLGYTTREDWYKITIKDIVNNYGKCLVCHHMSKGIYGLIKSIYPDYNWLPWKFNKMSNNSWKDPDLQKDYMNWLGKELGYTTMDDWYKISSKDIKNNYGSGLLSTYYNGSPIKLVIEMYPNYEWDKSNFINNKTEGMILRFLLNNISNLGITNDKFDQYKPDWCINPDTNRYLPYDFYIELVNGKKIIIECDGEQHYTQNTHFHRNDRTLEKQEDRDIYKMQKALDNNCSIIRVHQEEVYNDTIDWKKELTDAINEIKNENDTSIKLLGCLKDKICWILE